jgi:hypothetical protein
MSAHALEGSLKAIAAEGFHQIVERLRFEGPDGELFVGRDKDHRGRALTAKLA